ncbi:MAG: glutathione S-transferase family protein [Marinovum sp.]|nr:glutathione S-transferase family protein [Marinovum sp.]
MAYRLYNRLGSGGFVIQATLAAANIEHDYEPIASLPNRPLGAQIESFNKWGQVPVLELANGERITETAAILAHLSYEEPDLRHGPILWIDDHPQFLRWSVFLAVNIYEGILRRNYTHRYFSPLIDAEHSEIDDEWAQEGIRKAAQDRVHKAFLCLEKETAHSAFLLSDRMSACDIFLAMLYAWHNQKPDLPKSTWITTQVATHPIIRPIWEQNFHDRLDVKWHKL